MFQTTRRRLAFSYTAVTALLLLIFATGVYLYVRSTLVERIDDTLKHVIEVVERSLVIEPAGRSTLTPILNIEASFGNNAETVEEDRIDLEWFNADRQLLWSTFARSLDNPLKVRHFPETVRLDRHTLLRQITERVEINDRLVGYLRVSHPWFEVTKPSRELIVDLSLGICGAIACVAGIGWWLSGLAMQPVKDSYQSLKQFTADASHELRNPIATIQTNVQMLLAYEDAEPQLQQRYLKTIERLTQRLGHLVNDLLFLARSDSGMVPANFQSIPLDALLIEVIEEQRSIAQQKNIFLSLHLVEPAPDVLEEDPFTIWGDWEQLARLFTNLIGNALEYAREEEQQDREVSVQIELEYIAHPRNPQLRVKVKDDGAGISENALPHLFDRFYRADPSRSRDRESILGNSGLGLAIVKAIVDKHQGHIQVESEQNVGTTFTVMLAKNS
jgi:OmpR-family two-component system manganese-sensing sensor histidine kinase